ncbi:MAG: hypothetical protein ACO2PP_10770 [Thermocrinis sp.]|uniref:hypothetical protein n=1 Tax=Thermocrinis sp. TaxID=2024383 RepID=UPI003C02C212
MFRCWEREVSIPPSGLGTLRRAPDTARGTASPSHPVGSEQEVSDGVILLRNLSPSHPVGSELLSTQPS